MKKLLALLLVLTFVFSLSACEKDNLKSGKGNNSAQSVNNTAPSTDSGNDANPVSTTTSSGQEATLITREQAIATALTHAGINQSDTRDLEAELDRERGGTYWEVDFESGEYDYSYDINAETGAIITSEKERD